MTVDYLAAKGAPQLIPSGSPPTFAADISEIVQWLQKGRSFRRFTTQANLIAATGMEDNDLAQVDAIDGAYFKYDGSGATWRMYGIPVFDTASARSTAITTPADNMLSIRRDADYIEQYLNSAWRSIAGSSAAIIPTLSGTGGTTAVDSNTGAVTFSGAVTQIDVYVPTASIALLSTAKYIDITIGYTGSTVGTHTMQLLDGAGAVDATASSYFADYIAQAGGVSLIDNRAAATSWAVISAATRKFRRHNLRAFNLAVAQFTDMQGTFRDGDGAATNRIVGTVALVHEVAGIKAGFRISLSSLGTISNGLITIEAHY